MYGQISAITVSSSLLHLHLPSGETEQHTGQGSGETEQGLNELCKRVRGSFWSPWLHGEDHLFQPPFPSCLPLNDMATYQMIRGESLAQPEDKDKDFLASLSRKER